MAHVALVDDERVNVPQPRGLDHRRAVEQVGARHLPQRQQRRPRRDQHELAGVDELVEHRAEHAPDHAREAPGDDDARVAQHHALLAELEQRVQPRFVARRHQQ